MNDNGLRFREDKVPVLEWPPETHMPHHSVLRLQGRLVDRLRAFAMLKQDLQLARDWISRADEGMTDVIDADTATIDPKLIEELRSSRRAQFYAGVTMYGKACRSAKGRSGVSVDRSWIAQEFRSTHEEIMELRDNLTAHSGDKGYEDAAVFAVLKTKITGVDWHLATGHVQTVSHTRTVTSGVPSFVQLIDHLLQVIDGRRAKTLKEIGQVLRLNAEEVIQLAKTKYQSFTLPDAPTVTIENRKPSDV